MYTFADYIIILLLLLHCRDGANGDFNASISVGKCDRTSRRPFRNITRRIDGHISQGPTVLLGDQI